MGRLTTFLLAISLTLLLAAGVLAMGGYHLGGGWGGHMMGSGYGTQDNWTGHRRPTWGQGNGRGYQMPDNPNGNYTENDWRLNAPESGGNRNAQQTPRTDPGSQR